jgi:acyl-CoA synthetase (AMP-forming)/AMP-acid ligase II
MGIRDFTLADTIRRNAVLFPDRPAFIAEGRCISHRVYHERVERLAGGLAASGVVAGDRVAVLSQNNLEFTELYGAAAWLGAILLPVNWRLSVDEITYVLADGAPRVVIVGAEYQEQLAGRAAELPPVQAWFALGQARAPFQPFATLAAGVAARQNDSIRADDGFVIIHTAAVDGRPRGALLSHSGLLAASVQVGGLWSLSEGDVNLGALPLFHLAGLGMMLAAQQAGGASVILPKFEPGSAAQLIQSERATIFAEFAPMLSSLLDKAAQEGAELSSLRAVTGLDSHETIARFESVCPGARFWAAYGQSELSGFATMSPFRERPGSAGRATSLTRVAVVDEFDQEVPVGGVGEIVARGPMVFKGYWNRANDNAVTFRNGWHHTGDMGCFDADGYLWYSGRSPAKELIKSGGENVYPAEVEREIATHPAIAEVVVLGVVDPQWGEAIKAVCICKAGHTVTAKQVIDFVGARIARYKRPKYVEFVDAMPRTAAGTIDRTKVKELHGRA